MTPTRFQSLPDGVAALPVILTTLNQLAARYGTAPRVRETALRLMRGVGQNAQREQVERLNAFVRDRVTYLNDPVHVEDVTSPVRLLDSIERDNEAFGDCDDHVLLLSALCQSIGRDCVIAGVKLGAEFDHVVCLVDIDGSPVLFDPCAKSGYTPAYAEFLTV